MKLILNRMLEIVKFENRTTVSNVINPFVDNYDYEPLNSLVADETYIKNRGLKFIGDGFTVYPLAKYF